jgi:Tfp pilus assembly protein PilV
MSRIWTRLAAESGSIMIEVLIGTVLLALTTAAVLDGLDGAQKTGLENRTRSSAATLAQQDIERMRSMPPAVLANLNQARTVTLANVPYTVVSRADWVRDASGLVSCTTDETDAEYIRLSSTVTAPASPDRPVTETSLLTPPPGSLDDDTGTAAVKLTDRDGNPWAGVTVDLDGPSSLSATTNDVGCAVFAFIEADEWTASVDGNLVTWNGESPAQSEVTVAAGKTSLTQIELDDPGSLRATFVTPSGVATQWSAISVANAKLPNGYKSFQTGAMATSKDAGSLFPFHDGYGAFAGTCEANNPAVWDSDYFETSGYGFVQLDPGDLLESVQVVVPQLALRVRRSSTTSIDAAQVYIKQADSTYDCESVVYNSGLVTFASTPHKDFQIPLPFGRYQMCAATRTGTTWRYRVTSTSSTPPHVNLRTAPLEQAVTFETNSGSSSNGCTQTS